MAEQDNTNDTNNEEYQFREESVDDYSTEPKKTFGNIKSKFPLRRLLIPVGLIVGIYIVYQLLSWYSNRPAATPEITKPTAISTITKAPVAAIVAPSVKGETIPTPQIPQATVDSGVQQKLDALTQEAENNREQLANLNDTLTKNQQAIDELKNAIDSFSAVLSNIEQEMQKAAAHAKAKKKRHVYLPPKPVYHIKAIVPGRAWLETGSGRSVTVRVGNKLQGYGTVTFISSKDGMVITSTGDVIQYGINDY